MTTIRLAIIAILTLTQTGCVITYGYRERVVYVYDTETKAPASNLKIKYSHATPGFYIPKPPDPVTGQLNEQGRTTLSLPTVSGWIRVGDDSTILIDSHDITNGGTFKMHGFPTLEDPSTPPSQWTFQIQKTEQSRGANALSRATHD